MNHPTPATRGDRRQRPGAAAVRQLAVGVDGYPEGRDAVALAEAISQATGATSLLVAVHPDPLMAPEGTNWTSLRRQASAALIETRDASVVGGGNVWIGDFVTDWIAIVQERKQKLRHEAEAVVQATDADAEFRTVSGRPADALLAVSAELDLLAIGSRRWGPAARVLLGSTGEAVMHDAACAVVAVPRPSVTATTGPAPAAGVKPAHG